MKKIHAHLATSVVSFKLPAQVQNVRERLQGSVCTYFVCFVTICFSGGTKDAFLHV